MKAKVVAAALGLGMVVGSLIGGTQVGAAPQGGAGSPSARHFACECETKVTTSRLNLRSGPGTKYDVMLVMDEGAEVQASTLPDLHQNGFVKVKYGDNFGWAFEEYLADPGTGGEDDWGGEGYEIVGVGVTTARVNFRKGPGLDYAVKFVIGDGAQVAISAVVVNGFRYVWHAGYDGWVYDEYLVEDDGYGNDGGGDDNVLGTAVTNDSVNFRAGPGTSYDVKEVLEAGTAVDMTDSVQNGFRFVFLDEIGGWVHDAYLTPPASLPNAPTTGTATTTDTVNFRAGPGTGYSVREVLPVGTEVAITDIVQNGFRHVSVDGTMGWIRDDYLA